MDERLADDAPRVHLAAQAQILVPHLSFGSAPMFQRSLRVGPKFVGKFVGAPRDPPLEEKKFIRRQGWGFHRRKSLT
jgi:hypothetical protein